MCEREIGREKERKRDGVVCLRERRRERGRERGREREGNGWVMSHMDASWHI